MEHVKNYQKRNSADVYFGKNLHPQNRTHCVGKQGLDKNLTLMQMIEIAYNMPEKPNIIIKAGKNAKWYLKKIELNVLDIEIAKYPFPEIMSRCTMHIIVWYS